MRRWVSFGSLSVLLFIAACGGDAEVDVVKGVPRTPQVTGVVALPGGELARAAAWWQRLAAAVSAPVNALSGNATAAAGVTVELVRMDNADAVGPYAPQVLAETTTDSSGAYRINLPVGYDVSTCRLVVQVGTEAAGTLTRAFVYSTADPINIDYRSEATVRLVLAEIPPAPLCDFDMEALRAIYDSVAAVPGEVSGGTVEELNAAATTAAAHDPVVQGTIAAVVVPATRTPTRTATATRLPATRTSTASPASITTATATRTRTGTATATGTPTGTTLGTRTATTNTPTRTATRTATRSLTPMGTPAGLVLGSRVFSIADKPKSALFSSTAGGADVSEGGFSSGPIALVGGEVSTNGIASIALKEDVVFGLLLGTRPAGVTLGTRPALCVKLFAAGSSGSIGCDGGQAHDVELTVDSKGAAAAQPPGPPVTHDGIPGGAGAASLKVTTSFVNATVTSAADCQNVTFDAGRQAAYTTTTATAIINNGCKNSSCTTVGQINLSKSGVNFSCAQWSTENSVGTLLSPVIEVDVPGSPDAAMILQLAD